MEPATIFSTFQKLAICFCIMPLTDTTLLLSKIGTTSLCQDCTDNECCQRQNPSAFNKKIKNLVEKWRFLLGLRGGLLAFAQPWLEPIGLQIVVNVREHGLFLKTPQHWLFQIIFKALNTLQAICRSAGSGLLQTTARRDRPSVAILMYEKRRSPWQIACCVLSVYRRQGQNFQLLILHLYKKKCRHLNL